MEQNLSTVNHIERSHVKEHVQWHEVMQLDSSYWAVHNMCRNVLGIVVVFKFPVFLLKNVRWLCIKLLVATWLPARSPVDALGHL